MTIDTFAIVSKKKESEMVAKKTFKSPVSIVAMVVVVCVYGWICQATEPTENQGTEQGQRSSSRRPIRLASATQEVVRKAEPYREETTAAENPHGEATEVCPGVQMASDGSSVRLTDLEVGPNMQEAAEIHNKMVAHLSDVNESWQADEWSDDNGVVTVAAENEVVQYVIDQAHADCFDDDPFPSAAKCQQCHPGHYREWAGSPHAYAQLSPVFNAFTSKLNKLTNGTLGDFCIRCHTPVGMALDEPMAMSNMDRHPAAREGVTCVVCHRINQAYGKGSGRHALVGGGLTAPIYGPLGNDILNQVLSNPDEYGVMKTNEISDERGRPVHGESVPFFQLATSGFCGSCHDVFSPQGFRLEDAFSEYKASPAAREKGQQCQDCHMGVQHGVASGFRHEGVARVGNKWTPARKRTNHMMIGPDYSIVHPGIFPHNPQAVKEEHEHFKGPGPETGLATMREWLLFNYEEGWGSEVVERERGEEINETAPAPWNDQQMRFKAAEILKDQFEIINETYVARHQILSTGYRLGDVELISADRRGIKFRLKVWNGTDGHGVPTGFDAERLVFLRVTVTDEQGNVVFVSGDLDPNGDVRDSHSVYVHNGELPVDRHLFSLQSRFITRNIRGGEREQVLNVPYSLTPLPFNRPNPRPYTVQGRPLGARKHKQNLAVGGHRYADYHITPSQLTCDGPYHVNVQMISAMVPVNLVHEIEDMGFDYGLSAREVADRVVNGHQILHTRTAVLHINE